MKKLVILLVAVAVMSIAGQAAATVYDDFSNATTSATLWNTHVDAGGPAGWSRVAFDETGHPGTAYIQDGDNDGGTNSTWMSSVNAAGYNVTTQPVWFGFDYDLPSSGGSANIYLTPHSNTSIWDAADKVRLEIFNHDNGLIEFNLWSVSGGSSVQRWSATGTAGTLAGNVGILMYYDTVTGWPFGVKYNLVITPDSGTITTVSGTMTGGGLGGLDGNLWNDSVYIGFDASKREGTGPFGYIIDNVQTDVPEPVTLALLCISGLAMVVIRRHRRGI